MQIQMPKMKPSTAGAAAVRDFVSTSLLETYYPALQTEYADRDLVQQHCHN